MLPKGLGAEALGQRPIGVLPRLYRLWRSVRSPLLRRWEKLFRSPYSWGSGVAKGASDAVWASAVASEVAASLGKVRAAVFVDCVKA
eukprot:5690857-Alexandrium_andersonii.AAC.1